MKITRQTIFCAILSFLCVLGFNFFHPQPVMAGHESPVYRGTAFRDTAQCYIPTLSGNTGTVDKTIKDWLFHCEINDEEAVLTITPPAQPNPHCFVNINEANVYQDEKWIDYEWIAKVSRNEKTTWRVAKPLRPAQQSTGIEVRDRSSQNIILHTGYEAWLSCY